MAPRRSPFPTLFLVLSLLAAAVAAPAVSAAPAADQGFRALTGAAAQAFRLPADTRRVSAVRLTALGLTLERYQQYATRHEAAVDGAQLTVVSRGGEKLMVVGHHYPDLTARNRPLLHASQAIAHALADRRLERRGGDDDHSPLAAGGKDEVQRRTALLLDPVSRRLFYRVETTALSMRQFHAVDAQTGAVIEAWDALAHDHGRGVKLDRKGLTGGPGTADNLTRKVNGIWRMRSVDNRLITYDMANRWSSSLRVARDDNNHWTLAGQRAAVDAQYYARATDDFLRSRFGFNVLSAACGYGQIRSVVRFGKGYANAFWNGSQLVYGNGDGSTFRALSGAHDVVAHELTHAVTECTSDLVYWKQPGALNEAFSDIVATAAEFDLAEPLSSNCRRAAGQGACPDWWIGEDVWRGGGRLGLRSLADPAAGGQPGHYSQRYTGTADNGGVHINSAIPGHAFYLMATGGRNARCAGMNDPQPDCDVLVPGMGLADARAIAFLAYTTLSSNAQFCDARAATVAAAKALHPGSMVHAASVSLAWAAVGLNEGDCSPAQADFSLDLAARSLYLAPGGSGAFDIQLSRGHEAGTIKFSLKGLPDSWYQLDPPSSTGASGGGTSVQLTLPEDAPGGEHVFRLQASSSSRTATIYGLLVTDAGGPRVSLSAPRLALGVQLGMDGAALPVALTWRADDELSGVADARLEWSLDGADWLDITPPGGPGVALLRLEAGLHSFRVVASDSVGNSAISEASVPISVTGWQEGSATYSIGWSAPAQIEAWGTQRSTKERKRRATFAFNGEGVAWVAHKGPKQGRAKVFVDGVLVGKVDLYAKVSAARTVVFTAGGLAPGGHTLRIVSLGTFGRPRVGVDGFLVLSR